MSLHKFRLHSKRPIESHIYQTEPCPDTCSVKVWVVFVQVSPSLSLKIVKAIIIIGLFAPN